MSDLIVSQFSGHSVRGISRMGKGMCVFGCHYSRSVNLHVWKQALVNEKLIN